MISSWLGFIGSVVSFLLPGLCAFIAVGWYTLVERKVLGYIMTRKGPNKVGYMGLMQPVSDGIKLFTKEMVIPMYSAKWPFYLCPIIGFFISLLSWLLFPYNTAESFFACGIVYFMGVAGMSVYSVIIAGWASNSKYALLGAVRGVAQSVSYEVVMAFVLLSVVYATGVLDIQGVKMWQLSSGSLGWVWMAEVVCFLGLWIMVMFAESNRAPFDFVEGESELVSGYNVEYSGVGFGLLYMSEYSSMMFNSLFSACLFFGSTDLIVSIFGLVFMLVFVWARGTFPRYRYDLFMMFMWKCSLPLVLVVLLLELMLVYNCNS